VSNQLKNGLNLSRDEILAPFTDTKWGDQYPPILNIMQASQLTGIKVSTLHQMSSQGKLIACAKKVGKHLRFFRDRLLSTIFNLSQESKGGK
jgi:hypothetical protein